MLAALLCNLSQTPVSQPEERRGIAYWPLQRRWGRDEEEELKELKVEEKQLEREIEYPALISSVDSLFYKRMERTSKRLEVVTKRIEVLENEKEEFELYVAFLSII